MTHPLERQIETKYGTVVISGVLAVRANRGELAAVTLEVEDQMERAKAAKAQIAKE